MSICLTRLYVALVLLCFSGSIAFMVTAMVTHEYLFFFGLLPLTLLGVIFALAASVSHQADEAGSDVSHEPEVAEV